MHSFPSKFSSALILNLHPTKTLLLQTRIWSFCPIIACDSSAESSSAEFFTEAKPATRHCWTGKVFLPQADTSGSFSSLPGNLSKRNVLEGEVHLHTHSLLAQTLRLVFRYQVEGAGTGMSRKREVQEGGRGKGRGRFLSPVDLSHFV